MSSARPSRNKRPPPPQSDDSSGSSSEHEASAADSDAAVEPSDSGSGSDAESEEDADDVPVLSHAARRKQKKKALLIDGADGGHAAKAGAKTSAVKNTAELAPSKIPKRQNSVWVGNLAFKTTADSLKAFFDGVGEVTRVHMPMKMSAGGPERAPRRENRGFAYVDFASPDAKIIAIALSEKPLDGRRLLIKDGDDFNGRPAPTAAEGDAASGSNPKSAVGHTKTAQKILSVQKQPPGPTLFFGNLGFETTDASIRTLLDSHRSKAAASPASADAASANADKWIRKIRMGTFEDSGKCKGWAFVDFTTTEHATAALTNPRNHQLDGRKLVVEYASPDAVRRGGGGPPRDRERTSNVGDKRPHRKPRAHDEAGAQDEEPPRKRRRSEAGGEAETQPPTAERARNDKRGERPSRTRTRPGAALALAKRETVSIVPSEGKKIVF